jgi:hypothetical protein
VDMIIGRDNPEWMPIPMQEEPYERFTLMWTSLSSLSPAPPYIATPLESFEAAAVDLEDSL